MLNVDATTVSRRLKALEETLATRLINRIGRGGFRLTEAGLDVARVAEATEANVQHLNARIGNADTTVRGRVRLTAVPIIVNCFLLSAVRTILVRHPDLEIHLLPDSRNVNLMHREADIAIRLARPTDGGHQIKARRIGTLTHRVYEAKKNTTDSSTVPAPVPVPVPVWITYQDAALDLPQAKWIQEEAKRTGGVFSNVRVGDLEGAVEAAAHGYGRTLLPSLIGDADARLQPVDYDAVTPMIEREVWTVVSGDMLPLARIRVTMDWLSEIFG